MTAWKRVRGFPMYEVSDDGRVRSQYRTKKQLAPGLCSGRYPSVVLCADGRKVNKLVHRLVAEAFLPRARADQEVNHKNGVKTDNRVANLEWCSRSENEAHSFHVLGKKPNITSRKLEPHHVRAIRRDERMQKVIAADYGVDPSTISLIKNVNRWAALS
jgi:hypothetical protein